MLQVSIHLNCLYRWFGEMLDVISLFQMRCIGYSPLNIHSRFNYNLNEIGAFVGQLSGRNNGVLEQ